jgi:hypothetical protein
MNRSILAVFLLTAGAVPWDSTRPQTQESKPESRAESLPKALLEYIDHCNGPSGANLGGMVVFTIEKPANATTEGRFWARLTGGNTLAGFDNIRASCCNLDRSQFIRTLSLRTKLATSDKAQYPDVRFWTLNEVLEIRIERDDLAAALKKPATYSHHPPGTDDVTAWRALYVVLRAVAEDESWDSFATEAMDSSLTPRGEYPAAVELTLRADSSPDEVRRSLTAPFERLTKQFAAIGRVSHECGVDPGDPNNRKVARVSLRFEFRWDTKAPLIAASLGYQVEVTFPPPAYRYELKGYPRPKPAADSRPVGK